MKECNKECPASTAYPGWKLTKGIRKLKKVTELPDCRELIAQERIADALEKIAERMK